MSVEHYLVIGAGRMGGALLKGWLADPVSGVVADRLIIIDPRPGDDARQAINSGAMHLDVTAANLGKTLAKTQTVLLAIKPQGFADIAPKIAPHLPKDALVISILAGTAMDSLRQAFPDQHVIRAMPNTPAAIGAGITAFTCDEDVTDRQQRTTVRLLKAGGTVHAVDSEHLIDVVTAISGSGPAYVFHMVEALEAAALKIGLPEAIAGDFARQTIIGAGALLSRSSLSASELRQAVTSPGGTTQAALDVLMPELPPLMRETVKAAFKRAKELAEK